MTCNQVGDWMCTRVHVREGGVVEKGLNQASELFGRVGHTSDWQRILKTSFATAAIKF